MSGRINSIQSIVVAAQSMATDFQTNAIRINDMNNVSFEVSIASGTPSGTLAVQVSNSYGLPNQTANWTTLTSQAIVSGSPAITVLDVIGTGTAYTRVSYTSSGGTGVANIYVSGKS